MNKIKTSIYRCRIVDISYFHKDNKITCVIDWYDPINKCKRHSKGVAKCHPDDKYSIRKGERIAESRAKIDIYIKHRRSMLYSYLKIRNKCMHLVHKEKEHILDIINGPKPVCA